MTEPVADEVLMALADGELTERAAWELRARVTRDPDLAARYALFAETRALVQEPADTAPPSRAVDPLAAAIRAMEAAPAGVTPPQGGDRRPWLGVVTGGAPARDNATRAAVRRPAAFHWSLPAAAAVMFIVGSAAGYVLRPAPGGVASPADIHVVPGAQAALDVALTRTAGGQEVSWMDQRSGRSGRILIVATHRTGDGTVCREYQITTGTEGSGAIVGASCRRDGRWRTDIALSAAAAGSGYTPASGVAAVEDYLVHRGSSGPLAAEDERAMIDREWRAAAD